MTTVLEDGTEVCLPCPEVWSDSDSDASGESPGAASPNDSKKIEEEEEGVTSTKALEILASIPTHNHADRALADPSSENFAKLASFATLPPREDQAVDRLNVKDIDPEAFAQRYVGGDGRPAIITGVPQAEQWPAAKKWSTQEEFLSHYGKLPVQVTEMFAAHGLGRPFRVEVSLDEYAKYAKENTFDWPFYVWERNFNGERNKFLEDWQVPNLFSDDLYDITPEVREFLPLTCHLFLLVGGRRTGSNMHLDPKWSSAWNTILCGRKRWVMFPRDTPGNDIGALAGDAYKSGNPQAYWWLDHYPRLREMGSKLGMVDIIQEPGDTIFVPAGWWHATLNLPSEGEDVTIACTRNVIPPSSLNFVLPRMEAADAAFARHFVNTLRRLRSDAPRFLPAGDGGAERPRLVGSEESWQLVRQPASELSLARCRRDFIRPGRPLIIEGLGDSLLSQECCGLSREWLSANFGEKCVGVYRNFQDPSLRADTAEDKAELLRLREVLTLLRQGGDEAKGLYLYDLSLPLQLPGLLDHIKIPRYFTHCYLQQTMRTHCFSRSWPTLFIGAADSQSRLHVDQWHGHFWMHMISGRKQWTIFHPDDSHLLKPTVAEGRHHPSFPSMHELEEDEGFKRARRIDVVLEEGETLFVPGGAAHLVVNLTDSVAVAGNFIDDSNLDAALADLRRMAGSEADGTGPITDVVAALDEIEFDPDLAMHEDLLPPKHLVVKYRDLIGGAAARWPALPPDDDDF
mmetsp:Transcript_27228/g.59176  ORF Transcript_27228/g.59176 Transcript_27228/m.59176 type:complete len:742 (-) Transcript_27228:166-2391(-)